MEWVKRTFSDPWGCPSFKRQMSAIISTACIIGVFTDKDIVALAGLVAVILSATAYESTKKERG